MKALPARAIMWGRSQKRIEDEYTVTLRAEGKTVYEDLKRELKKC